LRVIGIAMMVNIVIFASFALVAACLVDKEAPKIELCGTQIGWF
jgi:hypothetical protein